GAAAAGPDRADGGRTPEPVARPAAAGDAGARADSHRWRRAVPRPGRAPVRAPRHDGELRGRTGAGHRARPGPAVPATDGGAARPGLAPSLSCFPWLSTNAFVRTVTMTQHDEQVLLSDVQVQAIREELQSQLMWRTSRLDELRALVEGGGGTEDGSKTNVLTDLTETELAIAEIRETLERLEDGSYGRCEDCGTAIPFERLKIRPLTRHCV